MPVMLVIVLVGLGVVLFGGLWSPSCADRGQSPGVVHMGDALHLPVQLTARDTPPAPEPRIVERLAPVKGIEPWQVVGKQARYMPRVPLQPDQDDPAKPALVIHDKSEPSRSRFRSPSPPGT